MILQIQMALTLILELPMKPVILLALVKVMVVYLVHPLRTAWTKET